MSYYMYELDFQGPVHFGSASNGGDLERVSMAFSSDQLFSALCNEASHDGTSLDALIQAVRQGDVVFSSLFPYVKEGNETKYFLCKPIYSGTREREIKHLDDVKKDAKQLKKLKKSNYVRCSALAKGVTACSDAMMKEAAPSFGEELVTQGVNLRGEESEPYFVGSYQFYKHAGLYCIVKIESKEMKEYLDQLFVALGLSGIGGKRSSGYGKFFINGQKGKDISQLKDADGKGLHNLLTTTSNRAMSIGAVVPSETSMSLVKDGFYKLKKRGGFVWSHELKEMTKRDSYFVVEEGSLFTQPLEGALLELKTPGVAHVIYRNGKALFVGVACDE